MLKTFSFINFFEFVDTVYSRYSAVHTVCSCLKNKSIVKLEKVAILSFTYLFVFYYYLWTLFYYNYSYFFPSPFLSYPASRGYIFAVWAGTRPAHTAKMLPLLVGYFQVRSCVWCVQVATPLTVYLPVSIRSWWLPRRNLLIADQWR